MDMTTQEPGGTGAPDAAAAGASAIESQIRAVVQQELQKMLEREEPPAPQGTRAQQAPMQAQGQAPMQAPTQAPGQAQAQAPTQTQAQAPMQAPQPAARGSLARRRGGAPLSLAVTALQQQERNINRRLSSNLQRLKSVLYETQSIAKQMEDLLGSQDSGGSGSAGSPDKGGESGSARTARRAGRFGLARRRSDSGDGRTGRQGGQAG